MTRVAVSFVKRLLVFLMALARSTTIMLCTLWFGSLYVFGLASRPTGRQMTSSYVGEAFVNGHRWAVPVAFVIDFFIEEITGEKDHCVSTYLFYKSRE